MLKNSQKQDNNKNDKLNDRPAISSGSFATSTSSNITVASAGAFDNPHTIIPGTGIEKKKEVED